MINYIIILLFSTIYKLTNAYQARILGGPTLCIQIKPPTCAQLDFPINDNKLISNCTTLKNINTELVYQHNYLCFMMKPSYITSYCINTSSLLEDCYTNIGNKINTLYEKNNNICSMINSLFSLNNTNSDVYSICNINRVGSNEINIAIILLIIIPILFGCGCCFLICCVTGCKCNSKEVSSDLTERKYITSKYEHKEMM